MTWTTSEEVKNVYTHVGFETAEKSLASDQNVATTALNVGDDVCDSATGRRQSNAIVTLTTRRIVSNVMRNMSDSV
jgi:hypothetical protein